MRQRREPRPRQDGLCALKTCRRRLGPLAVRDGDPFHTSLCCRRYYGVVFHSDEASERYAESRKGRIDQPTEAGRAHMSRCIGRETR